MSWAKELLAGLVSPVAEVFKAREERKKAIETAKKKVQQARADGDIALELSDAEWEALRAAGEGDTWKDEYITLIITSPILGLLAGGIWLAFTNDARLIDGVKTGIEALSVVGVDMGELMTVVVYAAVGLKIWRKF